METIKIKYHTNEIDKIKEIAVGDWIDLRAAETVLLHKGDFALISLGVSMKLPDGYEAHVVPRSSTFKNDIWRFPALAVRDTVINKNDRICQFRIVKRQPTVEFEEMDTLDAVDRGGFGSTGAN